MTGIYKITSPTGKVYIGQSVNVRKRFNHYKSLCCKSQPGIYRSLIKYGVNAHKFEVEHEFQIGTSRDVLNYHECFYMEIYRLQGIILLNAKEGGWNGSMNDEAKQKLSKLRLGVSRPYYTGKLNPYYGKKHSEEVRIRMSIANKGNKVGTRNGRARAIYQFDLNGNLLREWDTVTNASTALNLNRLAISDALNGRLKTSGNFKWAYK